MSYDPEEIIRSYAENAEIEDQAKKYLSLRTEIPKPSSRVPHEHKNGAGDRLLRGPDEHRGGGGPCGGVSCHIARVDFFQTVFEESPHDDALHSSVIDRLLEELDKWLILLHKKASSPSRGGGCGTK
jgi:hypothetical protein